MGWVVFCRGPDIHSAYLADPEVPVFVLEPERAWRFRSRDEANAAGEALLEQERQRINEAWPVEKV